MAKLTEFEITGDTRPYHFTAPNPAVATAMVLMLGDGQLGWRDLRHKDHELPVYRVQEMREYWCKSKFGMSVDDLMKKVGTSAPLVMALFRAFGSIELGLPGDTGLSEPQDYRDLRKRGEVLAEKIKASIGRSVKKRGRIH